MDDLQRRLGIRPAVNVLVATPVPGGEVGEKLFLLNPSEDDALAPGPLQFVFDQAARAGRTA